MLTFKLPRSLRKSAPLIVLLFLAPTLASCQTPGIGTAGTKPEKSVACQLYGRALTYSKTRDTNETRLGIWNKNRRFQNYGCKI